MLPWGKDGCMLPYLYFGDLAFPMYGPIIGIGFMIGCLISIYRSPKYGIPREDCLYAMLFGIIGVVVGGKVLYILTDLPRIIQYSQYLFGTLEGITSILGGGFVYYGGLFGGLLGAYIYCRMYKICFYDLLQTVVPVIPLIHGIGRVGCFCAGCCYGIPWDPPIGMMFTESVSAPNNIYLFPVQLLEAALNILLFAILIWIFRKPRKIPAVGVYLIGYGIVRLICERFRFDGARGFFLGLSTSQWISILVIPAGLLILWIARRRRIKKEAVLIPIEISAEGEEKISAKEMSPEGQEEKK